MWQEYFSMPWQGWAVFLAFMLLCLAAVLWQRRGKTLQFGCDPDKDERGPGGWIHVGKEEDEFDRMFALQEELTSFEKSKLYKGLCPTCGMAVQIHTTNGGRTETRGKEIAHVEHEWKTYSCVGCTFKKTQYWGKSVQQGVLI